jgi:ubiquinone/menaquinone biosynthesis C-methylase UbiE
MPLLAASVLSCPECLREISPDLHCPVCQRSFRPQSDGIIDGLPLGMSSTPESIRQVQATIEQAQAQDVSPKIVRYEQAFHDDQASYYDAIHTNPLPFRLYFERLIGQHVYRRVQDRSTVVDLCCGTGKSSMPLLRHGMTVIGMDVSREMLRAYRRKYDGDRLVLVQADASRPPLRQGSCDAIMMIGGLHHIPDRRGSILRCSEALREGGLLILHEPLKVGRSHPAAEILSNAYVLSNPLRVIRALGRRLGLYSRAEVGPAHAPGPEFTPYERSFNSADELAQMLPTFMSTVVLRSQCAIAGREFPPHLQHGFAAPLAALVVAIDYWLSDTGRTGWVGDAIFGVFARAS